MSVRHGRLHFMECRGVLPTTQFAYWKGLGTCDARLCVSHTLQSALMSGQEARIVQIDFSEAFYRVNHQHILCKLCSVGIEWSQLSILTQFISKRSGYVMVDGCQSKLVNFGWVSRCFGPVIVPHERLGNFRGMSHFADDSTLMDVVPSPALELQ